MATEWYVRVGSAEQGPFTSSALKQLALQGKVAPDTLVKRGTSGSWVPASAVRGLFARAAGNPSFAINTASYPAIAIPP